MSHTTILEGAVVLTGRALEPQSVSIALEGEVIASVGAPEDVAGDTAERADASGLVLIPGFIDSHVHIGLASPRAVLRGGVTTVRDLAWPPAEIFSLARASRAASFDGPEIVAAGPMLTVPGGYPTRAVWAPRGTGRPVTSADDARDAVHEVADAGAAVIKFALNPEVGPVLDAATLAAIATTAHERGLRTTGHVSGLDELDKALDAGADELAHMLMSAEPIPQHTIDRMVGAAMAVVPTLAIFSGRERATSVDNLHRFWKTGGKVIYGTDLGNAGPRPGVDPSEVAGMAEAGLGARDIVSAATVVAAEWLGLSDRGVIAPGARADIVGVPQDALDDPLLLTEVQMVWRLGRRVL